MRYPGDQFYFKSSEEMADIFKGYEQSFNNTLIIADRIETDLERDGFQLPRFPVPEGDSLDAYFEKVVWDGFRHRWNSTEGNVGTDIKHTLAEYEARLTREIGIIREMGFPSYFLITWDFIKYAREKGIPVGPGRGSAAGSLVAYSLRITDIDPLEHDLIFERFLNPERISMPDIDIDFCEQRRSEVIDYVTAKYGRDNVAQIITFGTMKARAVIRDVGRVLDIPYADVDHIAKMIPTALDATLETSLQEVPQLQEAVEKDERVAELVETAKRLEGISRHASTHAAGVVIAPRELTEFLPLYRAKGGEVTTQYDMRDVEDIGLLKMDFLGLRTLTLIDNCVKMIRGDLGLDVILESIPLDDANTYKLFSEGRTFGVFQFESDGMRDILRRFKPEKLNDLTALNALYRPGPIRSGMIDDFIGRKKGNVEVRYELPQIETILKDTLGVIVFQEQVMQLASTLAGFSLGQADILRKAMGKKKAEVMQAQRDKFIRGAIGNKIPENSAKKIFDLIEHFGGYGFNRSHSAAYALLAYQTGYLKANYPVYFMAALLTSEKTHTEKVVQYMGACRDMGIEVLAPDVQESGLDFKVIGDKIRFGLAAVKNVGEAAILSIISSREKGNDLHSIADLCENVDLRLVNKRVLESLVRSGSFDFLGAKRSQLVTVIDASLEYGQRIQRDRQSGQGSLFGQTDTKNRPTSLDNYPKISEWADAERLAFEKGTLGFYLKGHPLNSYEDDIRSHATCNTKTLVSNEKGVKESRSNDGQVAKETSLVGLIVGIRTVRTRRGETMAIVRIEDQLGEAEVVVFPNLYREVFGILSKDEVVLVKGKPEAEEDIGKILASEICLLDEVKQRDISAMTLRVPLDSFIEESLPNLRELLESHRGNCEIRFQLTRPDFEVFLRPHPYLRVEPSSELIESLEAICGEGSVKLSNERLKKLKALGSPRNL